MKAHSHRVRHSKQEFFGPGRFHVPERDVMRKTTKKQSGYKGRTLQNREPGLRPLYLLSQQKIKRKRQFVPFLFLLFTVAALVSLCLLVRSPDQPSSSLTCGDREPPPAPSWQNLSALLSQGLHRLNGTDCLDVLHNGKDKMSIHTSLDRAFQRRVERRLRQSMALAGVVVALEPFSGRILALAAFNKDPDNPEAFFWKAYPAASLFKVVAAAAALEGGRLTPESILTYTGKAHTLYQRDLKNKVYRWSNQISLKKAFARSVNSAFGKIGIYELGRNALVEFGAAFFFYQALPTEIPIEANYLSVPEEPYGIAEIACGFNRKTLLTPVHAAWMAGVIAAGGTSPAPWLVDRVQVGTDLSESLLEHQKTPIRVISSSAAAMMQDLMEATISYGTCRKSFAKRRRDRRLRPVVFGGKTGNLNNRGDTMKYDWFMGYAKDPDEDLCVALSVLMFHGEKLGHRANVMAFDLFRRYFRMKKK